VAQQFVPNDLGNFFESKQETRRKKAMGAFTIIKMLFSKAGLIGIAIVALLSGAAYVKHIYNQQNDRILNQQKIIRIHEINEKKLTSTIEDLKATAKAQIEISRQYNLTVQSINDNNSKLSKKLLAANAKIQMRNFEALRSSSHGELVMRIINKSVRDQIGEWNAN